MAMTPRNWSISGLSTEFGLDRRTVAARLKDIPASARENGHDVWRIADVAPALVGRPTTDGELDLNAERARLAKEQADGLEMKNARDRSDLLPRQEVHIAVTGAFVRVKSKLLAMPSKLAPLVAAETSIPEVRDLITRHVHEALAELATTRITGIPAPGEGGTASTPPARWPVPH